LEFLITGPDDAEHTIVLAHGAGAPMDSAVMDAACDALAAAGLKVVRFEFAYMAERRQGKRKPPPKAELLVAEYEKAVSLLDVRTKPIIGGKSMGGRIASMIADPLYARGCIAGLLCLGYPFHPPKKPEQLRTAHLERLQVPTLIVQGTRDPFGTRDEVEGYAPFRVDQHALAGGRRSRSETTQVRIGSHCRGSSLTDGYSNAGLGGSA
jgi:predicted alpha/beta-hydrolase family hydrolase